jgi:hypothetical protein
MFARGLPLVKCASRVHSLLDGILQCSHKSLIYLAIPAGFEPATLCLEGRCSSPAELRDRAEAA